MSAEDPSRLTAKQIQHEVAQILATGYRRLCEEARQGDEAAPSQQPSGAPEGQESAAPRRGERP